MLPQIQKLQVRFAIVSTLLLPILAQASVVEISGDVAIVSPPPSVEQGEFESNTRIAVFPELQGVLLNAPLDVDALNPGSYGPGADLNSFPPAAIPEGTLVSSYYLHADQIGSSGSTSVFGTVRFDTDILGIAFTKERLSSTRVILGLPTTTYDNSQTAVNGTDQIVISNDLRTVTFDVNQGPGADSMRVITQVVPLPPALWLFISGVAGLASIGMTRSNKKKRNH
ncbi:hypothetical protein [Halochromatium glycolicum]|uniref:hypothetical protein n=1 Tax=Halochromatium glycolicum TaxID=85075 RepID=UPI00190D05BE|nr:hypothetical protein [Halochromatium glycolicum]